VADLPVYRFKGYTFRPATLDDQLLSQLWNWKDPDHAWETQYPDYWIEQNGHVNSYVLEDGLGILFFVRSMRHVDNELEITLQFDREYESVSKARAMRGLDAGFTWLKEALPMNGFKSLFFVSKNEKLILFAEKRLRFSKCGAREIYRLKEA
jgi:hypothetical protein